MSNGIALPNGTYVEEYKIEKELGAGTFGVTYLATDTNLDKQVVIKEYLPNDIAIRQDSVTIMPKSKGDVENFEYGLDSFTKEAKVLAKFNHPNIVKVSRLFHKNGTAYFVMDYDEGEDLQEYIKRHSSFSEEEILSIIMPILDGLRAVHASDFLHRDIKPGNIYIRNNSSPMLIDFGASRMAMGIKSKSLSVVLTEGYAPKEQYSSTSKQGAYTDLYAIGAVMYKMATGITPPEASARADAITDDEPDPFVKLQTRTDLNYSDDFKKAIDWALKFSGKNRPQSVIEFQRALDSTQISPLPLSEIKEDYNKLDKIKIGQTYNIKGTNYILTTEGLKIPNTNSNLVTYNYEHSIELINQNYEFSTSKIVGYENDFIPSITIGDDVIDINMNLEELNQELQNGGKFVIFKYCISILIMTFKRPTKIYFIKAGEGTFGKSFGFTLTSLVLGWWGFPWGPIYTIGSIFTNTTGGKDVTDEVVSLLN